MSEDYGTPVSENDELSALDDIFGDGNLFDGVDIDTLPEDPFGLPDGTYRWRITQVQLKPTKNNPKKFGLILTYTIADGDFQNRIAGEWLHYPNVHDGESEQRRTQAQANLKNHLVAFGLSDEDIRRFNHRNYRDFLQGNEFWGTVYTKKDKEGQKRIMFDKMVPLGSAGGSGDSFDPFMSV